MSFYSLYQNKLRSPLKFVCSFFRARKHEMMSEKAEKNASEVW